MIANYLSTKDTTSAPLRKTSSSDMPPKKVYKTMWGRIFGEHNKLQKLSFLLNLNHTQIQQKEN